MPHTRLHVPEVPLRDLLGDLVWMEGHVSGAQKKALDQVAQAKQVVPGSDPHTSKDLLQRLVAPIKFFWTWAGSFE